MDRIVYLTTEGFSNTVFESQVRSFTNRLRSSGTAVTLIVLQPYKPLLRPGSFRRFIREALKNQDIIGFKPRFNDLSDLSRHARSLADRVGSLFHHESVLFHCRGPEAAAYALEMTRRRNVRTPVLLDVRGLLLDEVEKGNPARLRYFEDLERTIISNVDGYSYVSPYLRESYQNRYGQKGKPTSINVAAYDDNLFYYDPVERDSLRVQMKWQDRVVFVYAGGTQTYQSLDRILEAFKELSSNNPLAVLLLLLARPIRQLKSKLACFGIDLSKVWHFVGLSLKDIPRYLNASDWGLIFRTDEELNKTATPTKVAEYLGCGMRVIYGGEAGYYGMLIKSNPELGMVVPFSENLSCLQPKQATEDVRENVSNFARKNLSLNVIIESYKDLYAELCGCKCG